MNPFSKKFKVRISYFRNGKYMVQYAHYRFIPIWIALNFWYDGMLTSGVECWTTKLFNVEEAERVSKGLKSINDVEKWYKPYESKRKKFYIRKSEYYKKNVPYKNKLI